LEFFQTKNVQIIWQCGKLYYNQYRLYNDMEHVQVHAFLNKMDMAYAAADIIISRAGASSVSELCIVGKPVIFIPSPNVAEDHQTKNAEALVSRDAAIMVKDNVAKEQMIDVALALMTDENRKTKLSKNIKAMGRPEADKDIANEIFKLIK